MPALAPQLINAALKILDISLEPGQESTPLGRNWVTRYLKRNPHMRRTKQKCKEIEQSAKKELASYKAHFRKYKKIVTEYGI